MIPQYGDCNKKYYYLSQAISCANRDRKKGLGDDTHPWQDLRELFVDTLCNQGLDDEFDARFVII